jgi:hypothetical protein
VSVLEFIMLTKTSEAYPLIIEALSSPEREVAEEAACTALVLLRDREPLPDDVSDALNDFESRWPHFAAVARAAREYI